MSERITSPFGFNSTAMEVLEGIDLSGKRAIVTGGASGIGIETARALVMAGAEVTLAVRSVEAGEQVATDIAATTANEGVYVDKLDLADWNSIDTFVNGWDGPLHILINNAGVMAIPELQLSPEGYEMQFATNHLGHFRLSIGLHDALAAAGGARIVSVSSTAHLEGDVVFDDINFERRPYDPALAYAQSKTANVLFAVEATRRWQSDGINANAVHPGAVAATNLTRYYDPKVLSDLLSSGTYTFKTLEQGAATSVFVATSPLLDGIGGRYFEDCNEAEPNEPGTRHGVATYALDPDNAKRLWDESLRIMGKKAT